MLRNLLKEDHKVCSDPVHMQRAAINSALSLISDSLVNLGNTFQLINSPVSATTILELVEVADKRADDVSRLARRLLNFLQSRSDLEGESTQQGVHCIGAYAIKALCSDE